MWMPPGETVSNREQYTIQSPKFMVTIIWNPNGFYIVTDLPKGNKFNVQYYIHNILTDLE
jgi:uncharacterized membrane protein